MATETLVVGWALSSDITGIVTWIGTVAGVLSLIATALVYKSTSLIRKEFIDRVRFPNQLAALKECSALISKHLNGSDLSNVELRNAVVKATAISESLQKKLTRKDKNLRSKLQSLDASCNDFSNTPSKEKLNETWVKIQRVCEGFTQWLGDRNWNENHGT